MYIIMWDKTLLFASLDHQHGMSILPRAKIKKYLLNNQTITLRIQREMVLDSACLSNSVFKNCIHSLIFAKKEHYIICCLLKTLIYPILACQIELLKLKSSTYIFFNQVSMGFPHAHLSKITLAFTSIRMLFHHDQPIPSTTKFYHYFSRIRIMIQEKKKANINW